MPSAEKIAELPDLAELAREPGTATVARFEIRYSRFLDPKGNAVRALPDFAADRAELVALYRAMVLARAFDAKAVALQRTGPARHLSLGVGSGGGGRRDRRRDAQG